jgi:hypothetical protein
MLKIFYTASYSGKAKYQKYYDLVIQALERQKVEVMSPEKGNVDLGKDKASHYVAIKKGILWADAVVMEISNEGFQLGHEATLAIQAKKHVLCLSLHENFSEKIKNRYFHGAKYNEYDIDEAIATFVISARRELLSQRFNLFLSAGQVQFLEKTAKSDNMGVSEYLRLLIDKERTS